MLQNLTQNFTPTTWLEFLQSKANHFRPEAETENIDVSKDEGLKSTQRIGTIEWDDKHELHCLITELGDDEINARKSKTRQYQASLRYLKDHMIDGLIHLFYHSDGRFRLSFISVNYAGTRKEFSTFKRYSFYVEPGQPNKTFMLQLGKADFRSLESVKKTFSLEAVTDEFYNQFNPHFIDLAEQVQGTDDAGIRKDFALLFVIRTIFIGFVQKKGWLEKPDFLMQFYEAYKNREENDNNFYKEWLEPLFFEALNNRPGYKVKYRNNNFPEDFEKTLQMAPYLNGELFKRKRDYDNTGLYIPDVQIERFLEFLFQYNFTIEENNSMDEDLELNPEFLGIIFERLVNKADGAIYTPRIEVDMMCRLALQHWLEKNTEGVDKNELYYLFWRQGGLGQEYDDRQKPGNFSEADIRTIWEKLQQVTVCDPAVGSGAFPVGMMQVMEDLFEKLKKMPYCPDDLSKQTPYKRKQAIIARSLYGVEVKEWAVWIAQLRLWLSLFIDMDENHKSSPAPLLPNLQFKLRQGDALVQTVGNITFPVNDEDNLPSIIKKKVRQLRKDKKDFFYNEGNHNADDLHKMELLIYKEVIHHEIKKKKTELKAINAEMESLKGQGKINEELTEANLGKVSQYKKQERTALDEDIARLKDQVLKLNENHPLIWGIEFAEIFYEKGGFDIVIGNPPYLSSKNIADPQSLISKKSYKEKIKLMVRNDFPNHFNNKAKIDGRSDLYTFFFVRSLKLLNNQGKLCFITSNSWLDVGYGGWLQYFLLKNVPLHKIIDNHARRSFVGAKVNTVITLMGSPQKNERIKLIADNTLKFIAFKRPFEEAMLAENWKKIDQITSKSTENDFRVLPINHSELIEKGSNEETSINSSAYEGNKWGGKYLRAPEVFIDIVNRVGHKLLKLSDKYNGINIALVSGYVHDNSVSNNHNKVNVIKSVKNTRTIAFKEYDTLQLGVNPTNQNLLKGDILYPRTLWRDHLVLLNIIGAIGKEFYKINSIYIDKTSLALYINSTFSILQRELWGIVNLGEGGLKFSAFDLKQFLIHENLINKKITFHKTSSFLNREIKPLFEEIGVYPHHEIMIEQQEPNPLPDRKELDDIIFDAMGLNEEERKDVYRAVCRLVWNRISKAKSM